MQTQLQTALIMKNGTKSADAIGQVFKTYDYDKFKIMGDNRSVNLNHVQRLTKSFEEKQLVCPIIVNEKFEVIDGQHRLYASKEVGGPVYYIIQNGYGIEEVQRLNSHQKNWTKADYLECYCASGMRPYLQMKQFMSDFPELGFLSCERLVTNLYGSSSRRTQQIEGKFIKMRDFEEGKLHIPDLKKSYELARKVMEFKPYYDGFYKPTFISAVAPLFSLKGYDHKEMIHKLSTCPTRMQDCDKIESYRLLLQKIYNWKRRDDKVSFITI